MRRQGHAFLTPGQHHAGVAQDHLLRGQRDGARGVALLMVLALLACTAALGLTGWLYTTDLFWGYGWLADLHNGLGWTLVALVALHVAGVAFTSWQHRENLVAAMFTGRKAPPAEPGEH